MPGYAWQARRAASTIWPLRVMLSVQLPLRYTESAYFTSFRINVKLAETRFSHCLQSIYYRLKILCQRFMLVMINLLFLLRCIG